MRFFILYIVIFSLHLFADIALIKTKKGDVRLKRSYKITLLKVGDTLREDDIIITGKDGSVGIIFKDGTRLSLGAKSYIVIEKYLFKPKNKEFAFDLNMTRGKALFESGEFGKKAPKAVKFKVPKGIIGIDGTKFYVDIK